MPVKLVQEFESLGGKKIFNRRLESIGEKDREGFYELSFAVTGTEDNRRESTSDTGTLEDGWKARNIILAIPTVALKKIKWKPLQTDSEVMDMIDSVIPQEAIKLALEYPYAWWKALRLFRGRSITDLPIRQVLYFSDLDDLKKKDPFEIQKKASLLLASYSDIESVPFWRGLEGESPVERERRLKSARREPGDWGLFEGHSHGYRASRNMVLEAHQQVMRIHGQHELPLPSAAAYYDWGDPPLELRGTVGRRDTSMMR